MLADKAALAAWPKSQRQTFAEFPKFDQILTYLQNLPTFGGLVLGCAEADSCKKIFALLHFSSSTRSAHFCTYGIHSGNHTRNARVKATPGRETMHRRRDWKTASTQRGLEKGEKHVQSAPCSLCASENCTDSKDEISAKLGNR